MIAIKPIDKMCESINALIKTHPITTDEIVLIASALERAGKALGRGVRNVKS